MLNEDELVESEEAKGDKQLRFVELRGRGMSYAKIQKKLGISKATCSTWNNELEAHILRYEQGRLEDIYTRYHMTREARIRQFGEVLARIDAALKTVDFEAMSPERLLALKLKYMVAIKEEYTDPEDLSPAIEAAERKDLNNILKEMSRDDLRAVDAIFQKYENQGSAQ